MTFLEKYITSYLDMVSKPVVSPSGTPSNYSKLFKYLTIGIGVVGLTRVGYKPMLSFLSRCKSYISSFKSIDEEQKPLYENRYFDEYDALTERDLSKEELEKLRHTFTIEKDTPVGEILMYYDY